MKKQYIIITLVLGLALALILMIVITSHRDHEENNSVHSRSTGEEDNESQVKQKMEETAQIVRNKRSVTQKLMNTQSASQDVTQQKAPTIEGNYSAEDEHDILFVTNVMAEMNETGIFSKKQLIDYTKKMGYTPYEQREGHEKTGFRHVIKINEVKDDNRIIKEFYGAYYEHPNGLVFDRLYYGLAKKDDLFYQLVGEMDKWIGKDYVKRVVRGMRARWDFADTSFVFINGDYSLRGDDNKKIILIGKEWETH
ncbi:MAG: hypothetical protein OXC40_00540 [Proteobacteria bacterium]|nr:hypothetical protein [Pseudomonadota bacterium]